MGLLDDLGEILSAEQTWKMQGIIREIGVRQFLKILQKYRNWEKKTDSRIIKWGQQIEGNLLKINEQKKLELSLERLPQQYENPPFNLMPEYGRWMIEMIPSEPYSSHQNFKEVIESIRQRYKFFHDKSRVMLTIPAIPFLGLAKNEEAFDNTYTQSDYIDDRHIQDHIRFKTLTKNIRLRRGRTVQINVPIFIDKNTQMEEIAKTEQNPEFIRLDAMAFGMGLSCLQCTFSTKNLNHARYMYDQMHVISPIFLALTAGTPFHKGKLANWDARWKIVEGSVDDRNPEERDPEHPSHLPTSRYSHASYYIWDGPFSKPEYNDLETNIKPETVNYIKESAKELNIEIDEAMISHIANIFKRDILIVHEKFKTMSDEQNTLFEMLNGTNWNSVRLKIPPNNEIGWRVEFRTMEIQLMPDENAAYSLLIHFFVRALHRSMKLNFYMPMSVVQENFERAHKVDAVRKEKFLFRTNIIGEGEPIIEQLSIEEILFGRKNFPGLFTFIQDEFKAESDDVESHMILECIGKYLKDITSGKRLTLAQWIRKYIQAHHDYHYNSLLSKKTMDDLLFHLYEISKGSILDDNFKPIFDV